MSPVKVLIGRYEIAFETLKETRGIKKLVREEAAVAVEAYVDQCHDKIFELSRNAEWYDREIERLHSAMEGFSALINRKEEETDKLRGERAESALGQKGLR